MVSALSILILQAGSGTCSPEDLRREDLKYSRAIFAKS